MAAVRTVTSLPADTTPAMKSKASYVEVTYTPRGSSSNTATVGISDNMVTVTVAGDMASGDRIVVKYHNVRVQNLTTAMMKETAYVSVMADDENYLPSTLTDIKVAVPARSTIVMDPPRSDVGSIEESVRVIYTAKDVIPSNLIVVDLPGDWGPAYANDGGTGAGFGMEARAGDDRLQNIDLDGDTGPPVMAAVRTVTSLPADTTPAMKSKASYVDGDIHPAWILIKYC